MHNFRLARVLLVLAALSGYARPQAAPARPQQRLARPAEVEEHEPEEHEESQRTAAPAPASNLPPDTPVITIHGMGDGEPAGTVSSAPDYKTIVTRGQFDKLVDTLQPRPSPPINQPKQ